MNRQVEFRGKRLDNDEWMCGDLMHDNQGGCYIYPLDSLGLFVENKVAPDTVGQFTGMTDKHGKKIFEGDIVSRRDSAYGYIDVGIVKYDNSLGAFVLEYDYYERKCRCTFAKSFSDNDGKCTIEIKYTFEIIGNIWENKDLI